MEGRVQSGTAWPAKTCHSSSTQQLLDEELEGFCIKHFFGLNNWAIHIHPYLLWPWKQNCHCLGLFLCDWMHQQSISWRKTQTWLWSSRLHFPRAEPMCSGVVNLSQQFQELAWACHMLRFTFYWRKGLCSGLMADWLQQPLIPQ